MDSRISGFSPDLGLETISRLDDQSGHLPQAGQAALAGEQVRNWVTELFRPANLEQRLRAFAAVQVGDPSLLTPTRFESLVRASARALREQDAQTPQPELAAAALLLEQELSLRDLLSTYKRTLLRA